MNVPANRFATAERVALPVQLPESVVVPGGCNVNWAAAIGANAFRMRTYERGIEGETWSCGTGATAIALLAHRLGLAKAPIDIRASGGGTLRIELDQAPGGGFVNVRTTVEVERIAEGTLDPDWLARRGLAP